MVIPAINTKGKFSFLAPIDKLLNTDQVYTVVGQRLLTELNNGKDRPYETIYESQNMDKQDFDSDVKNDVPIIILTNDANEYYYIPANKIKSQPMAVGVEYQERILAIKLGSIPVKMDLTTTKSVIADDIYDTTGLTVTIGEIFSSAKMLVSDTKHEVRTRLLNNAKTVTKSYKTKYLEALETLKYKQEELDSLKRCVLANGCA